MVSPVWYNIRRVGPAKYSLSGEHDVDVPWMIEVRGHDSRGEKIGRILPRFAVDGWDRAAYQELMESRESAEELTKIIVEQVMYLTLTLSLSNVLTIGNMNSMELYWKLLFLIILKDF